MTPQELAEAVANRDRRALARAVTLVESTRPDHRAAAEALLAALPARPDGLRIGLTGTPGVGKSTFIEALGLHLVALGHRVAVLAVDPSSTRSGGAILGDKTRMERLARSPQAFIRPSPSGGALGGVARHTREVAMLCAAAGFDRILIETVGVGQSETLVAGMTDLFLLLIAPGGGDELQGVKRGIMELADLVLVNKADGDLIAQARATAADYQSALHLMRPRPQDAPGFPRVMTVSATTGAGLDAAWSAAVHLANWRAEQGWTARLRAAQARAAFDAALADGLRDWLARHAAPGSEIDRLGNAVEEGRLSAAAASRQALAALLP